MFKPLRHPARPLATLAALAAVVALAEARISQASELRRTAIVRAVQHARDSVVNIHGQKTVVGGVDEYGQAEGARRVNGMGTGVVIDERGYIITNHHVVDGVRRIQVTTSDKRTYLARLVSFDPATDLAVIKIDAPHRLPIIPLGTSADLMTGETVVAVGNAYGYEHTVTRGIVSALHRTVQVSDTLQYDDLIQTDASINPGNSGGPLLNIDGEMIGLNVAVRAGAQGIGFAIPVNKTLDVAAKLMSVRTIDRHWHGLETRTDGEHVVVQHVESDSPAERAGFKAGDVITGLKNTEVRRALDLERYLLGHDPGEKIALVVRRQSKPMRLDLVLSSLPSHRAGPHERAWDVLGVQVKSMTAEQFRRINNRYRGGLLITDVRPDGPAATQGIQAGDILVGMHVWETVSLDNLAYVLSRDDLGELDPLKFYIVRGQETLFGHLSVARK